MVLKWFGVVLCVLGWLGVFPRSRSALIQAENIINIGVPGFISTNIEPIDFPSQNIQNGHQQWRLS